MLERKPLRFKVAPHIVQDLGLNLYTSLPKVLVEFVANAYDADSPYARIRIDFERIKEARQQIKQQWKADQLEAQARRLRNNQDQGEAPAIVELGERTLPEDIEISIEDRGHGMSRDDLDSKFLVAGRRRREEEANGGRTPGGRIVMGRKGLGKLAGFGVARRVTVITRKKGETHATKIVLDYDDLIKKRRTDEFEVPEEILLDGGGIEPHGTKIVLSKLVYEPMKSTEDAIAHKIADHFVFIDVDDFTIYLNDGVVTPTPRNFVFAYPEPDRPVNELVTKTLEAGDGQQITFQYRLRFTGPGESLPARERGVRVYAHKRLAAAADLLDVPTGMHGFRMTDYLDGVVVADFIDEQPMEYIATDRQSLRWEAPLLAPMREFLSNEMKEACTAYQKKREKDAEEEVEEDRFTMELIESAHLPKRKRKIALKIAAGLASIAQGGKDSEEYKTRLRIFVNGLGQGTILQAISELAQDANPDLQRLVGEAARLTQAELEDFSSFIDGRLGAIEAFRKICRSVDFKAKKNEKELHALFKRAPWLIDPTFTQFLTSDVELDTTFQRLAETLGIDSYAPKPEEGDERRADLVFLLGNKGLKRLVIVELKAPNLYLEDKHLSQLTFYVSRAKAWLETHGFRDMKVEGYLIGTKADPGTRAEGVLVLNEMIKQMGDRADLKVLDILEVLDRTELAHRELLDIYHRISEADAEDATVVEPRPARAVPPGVMAEASERVASTPKVQVEMERDASVVN